MKMNQIREILKQLFFRPKIYFKGKNNQFIKDNSCYLERVRLKIWGDNNRIILDKNVRLHNTNINIGFPNARVQNCTIKIGEETTINSIYMQIGESNSTITIGKNCMFSYGIEINCSDHHSIFDENNNLINYGQSVEIGDRVWVCKEVRIQKNSKVPNDCIIGQGAIVAKKFDKTNCVIVGNPARIVKENIRWSKERPENVINAK